MGPLHRPWCLLQPMNELDAASGPFGQWRAAYAAATLRLGPVQFGIGQSQQF
jgi:hypothetical protein